MNTTNPRLSVRRDNGVVVAELLDERILEEQAIQQIRDELLGLIDQETTPKLLIVFRNVQHLSSATLGALIQIKKSIEKLGGQLRLSDINPQIQEVFAITKLDRLFQIHSSSDAASNSFS